MRRAALGLAAAASVAAALLGGPASAAPHPGAGDWRDADPENTLVIDTNRGRIIAVLEPKLAPEAVERLKTLARQRFYDGLTFFRVIDDFMAQTGDPQNNGTGGSSLPDLPPDFTFRVAPGGELAPVGTGDGESYAFVGPTPVVTQPAAMAALTEDGLVSAHPTFCAGVVGIARAQKPDSGNSQFFLMRQPQTRLDGQYAAVGRVVSGLDVVRQIKTGEPVPDPQDRMESVRVLADMPEGVRPSVRVIDTHGPYFRELAARLRKSEGAGFNPCDLEVEAQVK